MLKKAAMLLICLSLCTVTAFAACGRTTYSAKTEPSAEAKMTLGENKRNNMISVMQSAFGIDLTGYQFVSFGDL